MLMKKILMSLALLLVSICAFSQTTIDGLYRTFSDVKGAKSITIPKYMMSLVKVGTNTEKNKVLQKVDAVKFLELDNCKKSIRKNSVRLLKSSIKAIMSNLFVPVNRKRELDF